MDWLEDMIRENKDKFWTHEPSEGHFERFESRLVQQRRKIRIQLVYRISAIAAIGLILISSSIFIYDRFFDRERAVMTLGDLGLEMQKVEFYFTSQIDQLSIGIDSLSPYSTGDMKKLMDSEVAEMDSLHLELQKKLKTHPGDERVVNAMISYYQAKLSLMQNFMGILTQIKQSNNSKKEHYESTLL